REAEPSERAVWRAAYYRPLKRLLPTGSSRIVAWHNADAPSPSTPARPALDRRFTAPSSAHLALLGEHCGSDEHWHSRCWKTLEDAGRRWNDAGSRWQMLDAE